jgi:putative endonuclease
MVVAFYGMVLSVALCHFFDFALGIMSLSSYQKGQAAERYAKRFLCWRGLWWVESNYRCAHGELDLIFISLTSFCWVFVEVRSRTLGVYGDALASINRSKKKRLINSAQHYMKQKRWGRLHHARIDVLGLTWHQETLIQRVWLRNAVALDDV